MDVIMFGSTSFQNTNYSPPLSALLVTITCVTITESDRSTNHQGLYSSCVCVQTTLFVFRFPSFALKKQTRKLKCLFQRFKALDRPIRFNTGSGTDQCKTTTLFLCFISLIKIMNIMLFLVFCSFCDGVIGVFPNWLSLNSINSLTIFFYKNSPVTGWGGLSQMWNMNMSKDVKKSKRCQRCQQTVNYISYVIRCHMSKIPQV